MSDEVTMPEPPLPPPLLRTTPSTTAITITRTTPPAIASARGEAWRARGPLEPFERTGGGAVAAADCLCCLALLPLGMGGKGSRCIGFAGGCKDQESDDEKEGGEGESRDREIAERVVRDPVGAASAGCGDGARLRLRDHAALDQHVVDRRSCTDDRQRNEVAGRPVVAARGDEEREDRERIHQHSLEPAELAGDEGRDLRVEKAAARRDGRDDEGSPELVAPEEVAERVERSPDAHQREHADHERQDDEHLSHDAEDGEDDDYVLRHPAAGYPSLRWALR